MVQFSKGIETWQKHDVADILQVPSSNNVGIYLRCKNIDHKRTKRGFVKIKEKINNKLTG